MAFRVVSIRRYPVKAMGGEALDLVHLDQRGLAGDRWFAIRDHDGLLVCGKDSARFRHHEAVYDFSARTRGFFVEVDGQLDGEPHTWRVGRPELDAHLSQLLGFPVSVQPEKDLLHQDSGAISIIGTATLDFCAREWGVDADPRRLRTNLVLETQTPFIEQDWIGWDLVIGTTRIAVTGAIERCDMVEDSQDGATGGDVWAETTFLERDGLLGVYADVLTKGAINVGDRVKLSRHR